MISKALHIGLTGAFLLLPPSCSLAVNDPGSLATLMPYGPAPTSVEPVPAGYKPVFVESLNRHGSRALASPATIEKALGVWRRASAAGALTDLGASFGPDLQKMEDANLTLGYGNLSGLGGDELEGIGERTATRLPTLFSSGAKVELVTSGVPRAIQSAEHFSSGLKTKAPAASIGKPSTDTTQLHFDVSDRAYAQFLAHDGPTKSALAGIDGSSAVVAASRHLLERVYSPDFVRGLGNPVSAARAIYGVYAIAPGMGQETDVRFGAYVDRADARVLGYVSDAHYFYQRGPGIEGRDDSYAPARLILDDFFRQIDARLAGGSTSAVFRFAHAEQLIPFAALLHLPGSIEQATPDEPYSLTTNEWRGDQVSRLAANIQWIVYASKSGAPIVAMLYNERSIPFDSACTPIAADSYLYALTELKDCLRP